jgi:UDP-glucuronate 4-epimerase
MSVRILITGAAGFIGFHIAKRLLTTGATVHGIDNLNDYYDVNLKQARLAHLEPRAGFTFARVDIADATAVAATFKDFRPDVVIHLAAQAGVRYSLENPRAYASSNIDGFLSVLEAARAHPLRHLIYASSSSVYGANTKVPFVETDPVERPVSLYSATKRANELMARTYAHLFGIPCSGLRFFTVYGPWGRPDMAYFSFTKALLEVRSIDVFNHGQLRRDFTYVDDIIEAITRLVDCPPDAARRAALGDDETAPHLLYNVGNNTPVMLQDFIAALERVTGRTAHRIMKPMQPGDVLETYADVTRLASVTGFAPATPLEVGLTRFVDWYRGYNGP